MMPQAFSHVGEQDRELYHYTECGLDDIYLLSGYSIEQTSYGEGVSISHVDELHDQIGYFLITEKKVLSGKELRFLRKEMDLTQAELGILVGLSDQQVARWEKEQCGIPNAADYLLRHFYLKHINKEYDLRDLIEALKKMDAQRPNQLCLFEDTEEGWKPRKAA
jgi:putative transcriptional regulator